MIHTLTDLLYTIIIIFCCIALGYFIGNLRGRRKSRQETPDNMPFLIYDRESDNRAA